MNSVAGDFGQNWEKGYSLLSCLQEIVNFETVAGVTFADEPRERDMMGLNRYSAMLL